MVQIGEAVINNLYMERIWAFPDQKIITCLGVESRDSSSIVTDFDTEGFKYENYLQTYPEITYLKKIKIMHYCNDSGTATWCNG